MHHLFRLFYCTVSSFSLLEETCFRRGKKKIVKKSSPKQVRLGGAIQMCKLVKIFKGGVLKYLRFSKILFHGQKRKKIYSSTHPFLMIKNCFHVTHKMHPPLALF